MPNPIATAFTPANPAPSPATATAELTTGFASIVGPHMLTPTYVNIPSRICAAKNASTTKSPNGLLGLSHRLYKCSTRLPFSLAMDINFNLNAGSGTRGRRRTTPDPEHRAIAASRRSRARAALRRTLRARRRALHLIGAAPARRGRAGRGRPAG